MHKFSQEPAETKVDVLGVKVSVTSLQDAAGQVMAAADAGKSFAATALATHGVMTGVDDPSHEFRLNSLDLVTPDGQPVRWAMNILHGTELQQRTYGPDLMREVCLRLSESAGSVALYGSTPEVLAKLQVALAESFAGLRVAFAEPSRFRQGTRLEMLELSKRIRASRADVCFVGLGCPRQEVFVYEIREMLPIPVVAVGAAFDFLSGSANEPPKWMQDHGLQWLQRLVLSPRRLGHRYLVLGPRFISLVLLQLFGRKRLSKKDDRLRRSPPQDLYYL